MVLSDVLDNGHVCLLGSDRLVNWIETALSSFWVTAAFRCNGGPSNAFVIVTNTNWSAFEFQRRHQAFECSAGGKHNVRCQQESFCAFDQFGRPEPVKSRLGETGRQAGFGVRRERHETEVPAHAITNGAVGRLSRQDRQPRRRIDADLAGKMDDGLMRDAFRGVGEAPSPALAAQMQRGP
jgi:hypothetical protein